MEPRLAWAVVLAPSSVALQLVPLPAFLLRILSPSRSGMVASLETVMQPPTFASLSINPTATVPYLLNIIAYALTFLLVREIAWRCRQRQSWAPVVPLIGISAVEAGLGLLQAASRSDVQGTYRSRDHFAGLLEMALPMTVAYAIALLEVKRFRAVSSRGFRTLGGCVVLGLAAVILLGLARSLSRMGFVAGLSGLFVMGVLAVTTTLQGV